jgi:hypothetical protein
MRTAMSVGVIAVGMLAEEGRDGGLGLAMPRSGVGTSFCGRRRYLRVDWADEAGEGEL